MPRLLLSIFIVGLTSVAAIQASSAFFSDVETSTNNVFAAGAIDLKIGNSSYYNGAPSPNTSWVLKDLANELFFNFTDVKPGDMGEDTIVIQISDNDAWACANVRITKNDDNNNTEPELTDGDSVDVPGDLFDGELAQHLYFALWNDDGDNVLETGEDVITQGTAAGVLGNVTWPLADSQINTLGEDDGEPLKGGKTYHIGKAWCFGDMSLAPLTQDNVNNVRTPIGPDGAGVTCDGSKESNITQTDILMGDISFYAVQSRNNPDYICGQTTTPTPSISITPSPTPPIACFPAYASAVVANNQGTKKNDTPITDSNRMDPNRTIGPADNQFYSLGKNGNLTVAFSTPISNILGYDLSIDFFEITNGRDSYPEERASIEVSQDGVTFVPVVPNASSLPTGITNIDFSGTGLSSIQFVRMTDATNFAPQPADADGFDVDAIRGNCRVL